ncbi:chitinase-like protein PB1E7.04c isoform X3 [Mastomys coucha]|uniref:chitinase-like protein PB1E7.04c isoform X3 n=1 Tax=Mastomys coucha TaxID=35658 RepID=UPI0012619591|nr:chitinase-like protein PB1E7.04c isoform X3 [Mastomys coucha]
MNQKSSGLQSKETEAPSETQDPLKVTSSLLDDTQGQKTNTKTPMPIIHTRKLSSVDPSTSTPMTRRVSIQEPPASLFLPHRVSAPCSSSLSTILPRRLSTQETLSQGSQSNIQDIQSVAYNRWLSSRETSSLSHNHRLSILSSHTLSGALSEIHSSQSETEKHPSTTQSYILNRKQVRSSVDVPPSITQSPQASIRSFESFVWDSKESLEKELSDDSMSDHSTLDSSSKLSSISTIVNSNRAQSKYWTLLPIGWRLLLEAKKISRHLSLVLTVAGMVMLSLIALWMPWIHFQVPLVPPGDPAGPKTIPIDTTFFMRCPDISCMNEYDKNAYLLDIAWACLLISGVMSFCVCMGLISTIFFPSTNLPLMDFSLFICSLLTGVNIILGVLFYLMQARKFLQEGLFSYLNYINFWSILSLQASWS